MIAPHEAAALRDRMAPELPPGLVAHIDRVVALAERLTMRHGGDVPLARLMAQGHDLLRAVPRPELLARAEAHGLTIDPAERADPVLLHGPLGALELERRFGVTDSRALHAVRWHTTGHPDYGLEAWAMFIADKIDPHKIERWSALRRVRRAASDSLEDAALIYLELVTRRSMREGWPLHPMAIVTRNALLLRTPPPLQDP